MSHLSLSTRWQPGQVIGLTCMVALLYAGRPVLQPIAAALILCLALMPLIRTLGLLRMSRAGATLSAIATLSAVFLCAGAVLAAQVIALSSELPQYRSEIRAKYRQAQVLVERSVAQIPADLFEFEPLLTSRGTRSASGEQAIIRTPAALPVEIHTRATTNDSLKRAFSLLSGPVGEAAMILVLLIFILLDHESLRDRIIRLAGKREIGRTVRALEDAAQGVSRFFFSQVLVNIVFSIVVSMALWLLSIPHAPLWGALSAVLRFVPYIGALIAGASIAMFAAAVAPGWWLPIAALSVFLALEVLFAYIVEPRVYGHSSGISPLAVIVSAIFWSALWGPVGLLLSTPLTLCLVVAGRYVRALEPFNILFGEIPSTNVAQRFYHRALSGDSDAIIADARRFLSRSTLARYCDQVLLPGMALAAADVSHGYMDEADEKRLRDTVAAAAETLANRELRPRRIRRNISLLDESIGAHLRHRREERLGRWQGSLDVDPRSIVLCVGLSADQDELLLELLVMSFREVGLDARSLVLAEGSEDVPEAENLISTVFVVYPSESRIDEWRAGVSDLRASLPDVPIVTVRSREHVYAESSIVSGCVDLVLQSMEEGLAFLAPARTERVGWKMRALRLGSFQGRAA